MSISTTWGCSFSASSTAAAPSAASPTTSKSGSEESSKVNPDRTIVWSSAISTRICSGTLHLWRRDSHSDFGALAGPGDDADLTTDLSDPLAHADQSQAAGRSFWLAEELRVETHAVVSDLEFNCLLQLAEFNADMTGACVPEDVGDRFLDHPKNRGFQGRRQASVEAFCTDRVGYPFRLKGSL